MNYRAIYATLLRAFRLICPILTRRRLPSTLLATYHATYPHVIHPIRVRHTLGPVPRLTQALEVLEAGHIFTFST